MKREFFFFYLSNLNQLALYKGDFSITSVKDMNTLDTARNWFYGAV
jgi:hypothetical protein